LKVFFEKLGPAGIIKQKDLNELKTKSAQTIKTEAVVDILKSLPRKIDFKPMDKTQKVAKTQTGPGKCKIITNMTQEAWTARTGERTVSWCLLRPDRELCDADLTFCFDVDEVRKWIEEKASDEKLGDDTVLRKCPMFGREQLESALQGVGGITIPENMTEEFRIVIEEFEMLPPQDTTISKDYLTQAITEAVERYFAEQVATKPAESQGLMGTFWQYTKDATMGFLKSAKRLAIFLLKNPFWLMVVTTVAKIVRILICAYFSFNEGSNIIIDAVIDKLQAELGGMFGGIPKYLLTMARRIVKCAARAASLDTLGFAWDCAAQGVIETANFLSTKLSEITTPILNVFDKISRFTLDYFDKGYFVDFAQILRTSPFEVSKILLMSSDSEAKQAADKLIIYNVVSRWERFQDWEFGILILLISKIPDEHLWRFLKWFPPLIPLRPFFALFETTLGKYGNPIYCLKLAFQGGAQLDYIYQAFHEIREWIFDLVPCLWNTFIRKFKYFFGFETIDTTNPDLLTTCCMTEMIATIQKQLLDNPVMRVRKESRELVASISKKVGETAASAAASVAQSMSAVGCWFSSSFCASADTMEGMEDTSNWWIMGNTNNPMIQKTVFELKLETGEILHFYVYFSKPDPVYHTGYKVFISIPLEEVKRYFPKAVWTYYQRDFIVLKQLPIEVTQQLMLLQTPMVDMTQHIPQ